MGYISKPDDHNCCDGRCDQGDECPLYRAPSRQRSVAEFPYAPGRLGSRDYEDDPPLTRDHRTAVGVLIAAVVVLLSVLLLFPYQLRGSAQYDRAPAAKPARVMT